MAPEETLYTADSEEKSFLEKTLHSFSVFSGLKALLVDDNGVTLVSTENQVPDGRFCKLIKDDPEGHRKCCRSYARAGREAAKYGEPYVFRCHAGLINWAVPIKIGSRNCAIICGQVLMWEIEDYFLDEITMMVKDLNVDLGEVKLAALELNYLPCDKVQAVSELLFVVANQIMNEEGGVFSEQKSMTAYQAVLSDKMAANKKLETLFTFGNHGLRHSDLKDAERSLLAKIRSGDQAGAQKELDAILVQILNRNAKSVCDVKGRIVELLVSLSQVAVDEGMNDVDMQELNSGFYEELYHKETTEEICYWTKSIVDIYSGEMLKSRNKDNYQAARAAAEYIKRHFKEKISVADVGKSVHLSGSYLSHIFSETFGRTLTEYLTDVRVEYAKKLLAKPKLSISEVAYECGFEDVSYFSRVFKKAEGITPRDFKKKKISME